MSDKNCGDMNDNGVLKNPNKIRKSNAASSLVKTFGRSFKIRKSNILSTIPSALVSRENMPDIEADNKYYISSLTDEQVQRLYFAELVSE
ncbi:hypothetical protein GJ496_005788 [Pomphorhynchus laevis]|nr:hypothetical protein GJ496_005788 [Pomphorhynchus laevis]